MNKFGKRILTAAVCAGVSALALTGCSSSSVDGSKVAVTVEGTDITLGELNFMLRYEQANMEMYLGALFGGSSMWSQDLTGSGEPYGTTLKNSVLEELENMVACENHMADYGIELTDEEKTAITDAAKLFIESNDEKTLKAMTADQATVERVLTLQTISSKVRPAIEADVDTEVSDEEAAQKTIQYAFFSMADTTDEEGNTVERTDEEKAEIKQQAQDVIDAIKGGETFEDALAAVDESRTPTSYSYGEDEDILSEVVKEAADAMTEDGEIVEAPVEAETGVYVVQMKSLFDEEATADKKEEIIQQRKNDLYEEVVTGWREGNVELNEELWNSLTFDVQFTAPETETEETEAAEETTEAADAEEASEEETAEEESAEEESTETEEETTEAVSETESEEETTEAAAEE